MSEAKSKAETKQLTIKLRTPVTWDEEQITQLAFRKGRMGDLDGIEIGGNIPITKVMLVASRMCGQPVEVLKMLEEDDAGKALALALGFIQRCLTTGAAGLRS